MTTTRRLPRAARLGAALALALALTTGFLAPANAAPLAQPVPLDPSAPLSESSGLRGDYRKIGPGPAFEFTGESALALDGAVNYRDLRAVYQERLGAQENVGVSWTGTLTAPATGEYTFSSIGDNGLRMWVGGAQLIDFWVNQFDIEQTAAAVVLEEGRSYEFRFDTFQATGGANAFLRWSGPGIERSTVPVDVLAPPADFEVFAPAAAVTAPGAAVEIALDGEVTAPADLDDHLELTVDDTLVSVAGVDAGGPGFILGPDATIGSGSRVGVEYDGKGGLALDGEAVPAFRVDADNGSEYSKTTLESVDQFIGTRNDLSQNKGNAAYGNTFPGATVPFGMVQLSPTTYSTTGGLNWGGYEYDADQLRGFGMTRLSGTGCANNNGAFDFPVLPYSGALTAAGALPTSPATAITDYYLPFSHADERATPGHYEVDLADGTEVSLTATTRTGIQSYDFADDADSSTLIFDVAGGNNASSANEVHVDGNRVYGQTTTRTVCSGADYTVYFSATFDQPIESSGTWSGPQVAAGTADAASATKHGSGAFVTFADGAEVTAEVGLSYVSSENAQLNADTETAGLDPEQIGAAAAAAWSTALDRVAVTGGDNAQREKFATALYHSLLHPNVYDDVNGEYFGYDGTVRTVEAGRHQYATYSGWDMYRGQTQLIAMLFPDVASDIAQSITDLVTQTGDWPNWPHNGSSQQKMTGDGLQVVLTELDAFGATDYDREAALESLVASRTLPSDSPNRARLYQYAGLWFIENRNGGGATSETLEYAITDFATARFAERLGDGETAARFQARSQNWRNVFDGASGDIRPRERTGFDASMNLGDRDDAARRNQFDQGTGYQYGWLVPHDMAGLIAKRGGVEAAASELDEFFTQLDAGVYNTRYAYLSNEGDFQTPWIYNWLRQPAKTTDVLDRMTDELFGVTPTGLPGNDDLGALSSLYVWASIGLYPSIYGTAQLSVSSPMFERVDITPTDPARSISIGAPGAAEQRYIQSMTVDGAATTRSWLDESFVGTGGAIEYGMGAAAGVDWGTGATDVPPSYGAGADDYNNVGTTADAAPGAGSLDVSNHSLSREDLATAGASPGAELELDGSGLVFEWPDVPAGAPDNWMPHGQSVPMGDAPATSVSFLGLATNGPSQGTARVVYTDGSSDDVPVQLPDWTATGTPVFGNTEVVAVPGRNTFGGTKDAVAARVFATAPVALDAEKRVAAITLPATTDRGIMHIFDVALAAPPVPPTEILPSTPVITGYPAVGSQLIADPGEWMPVDVTLAYQWSVRGVPVPEATSPTFEPRAADRNKPVTVTVTVTGSSPGLTPVSATSAPTARVGLGTLLSPVPRIEGRASVGQVLQAVPGDWTPGTRLSYQWTADGRVVRSATEASWEVTNRYRGMRITVTVTGTKPGYATTSVTSARSSVVTAAPRPRPRP